MPSQPRILLIEAAPSLRHTLAIILRQAGYVVTTARHAQDALRGADAQAFDLIFLDVDPVEPGNTDLLQAIDHLGHDIPTLILAGSPAAGRMNVASSMERRAYLVKPIDPTKMLACIRDLLDPTRPLSS